MTLHARSAGAWATVQDLYIRQSGVWVPVQQAYVRNAGAWTEYYAAEVVVTIAANSTNVNISALFTSDDWTSVKKKRVIVQSGVTIGSTSPGTPAMQTGTGWGGQLTLDNNGTIQGAGGVLNSGIGGGALFANAAGLIVNNTGIIRSGGGGGGRGGAGSTTTLGTRSPTSGFTYSGVLNTDATYWNANTDAAFRQIAWGGAIAVPPNTIPASTTTQYDYSGYRYYRGVLQVGALYSVARQVLTTTATTGGSGGRGQGHDGAAAAGAVGGTNAGTGGTGGAYGATGATGAAGNAGSGVAGGLAGISYNAANITMNNTGTITGRTS